MTTTSRTTSSVNMGGGRTRVTRVTGNKISTSYKTKTKTGNGSCITQTSGPRGFTTTSSNKSGVVTRSVTTRSSTNKPSAFKSSSKSRSSSRSSRSSSGDAGVAMGLLLLIGLFTGLWFAIKSIYSWATKQKALTVTPEVAPAIEANADPLILK